MIVSFMEMIDSSLVMEDFLVDIFDHNSMGPYFLMIEVDSSLFMMSSHSQVIMPSLSIVMS